MQSTTTPQQPELSEDNELSPEDERYVCRLIAQIHARNRLPLMRCVELAWRRIERDAAAE